MNINVRRRLEIPKGTSEIKPTVMGCIWYHPTIGKDEEIHRTPFSGNISMKEDVNHNPADDLSDHFKSGQQLSLQNRPTGLAVRD
jgi:hypothetical protein